MLGWVRNDFKSKIIRLMRTFKFKLEKNHQNIATVVY